jgi:hypothetical protein
MGTKAGHRAGDREERGRKEGIVEALRVASDFISVQREEERTAGGREVDGAIEERIKSFTALFCFPIIFRLSF